MKRPTKELDSDLDVLISKMQDIPSWNSKKLDLLKKLKSETAKSGYIHFTGNTRYYFELQRVGNEVIFPVPSNRRGILKKFRNKTVRIICIGSGRFQRDYAAGLTTKERKEPEQ